MGLLFLFGCTEVQRISNPLVGNWKTSLFGFEQIITIQSDKTIYITNPGGTSIGSYELNGDKIILSDIPTGKKLFEWNFAIISNYKALKIDGFVYYPINENGEILLR